jgi:chaperonin cofactor prefoldin
VELEKVQAHCEQLQLKIETLVIDLEASKKQQHDLQARVEELTSDLDSR